MSRPTSPRVIAHRGASGHRPENTFPAYDLACAQGADMIEVDLHTTRDGAIVIAHDAELESLGGTGEIADASLAQVRSLDAGAGERVPTLEGMLDRYGARIPFNLELKRSTRGPYPGMEEATLAAVRERGLLPATLFSSFYDPVLEALRAASADARIALLVSRRFPDGMLDRARKVAAEALNPELPLVDAALVEAAHDEGLAVYVFTVDAVADMNRLLDLGVDGLFTNYPDRLLDLLDSRRQR